METQSLTPIELPAQAWRYLIHSLFTLLPPPDIDTPEALLRRNQAAIARIAALTPVNAAEAEHAAQCIIACAQADDVMRLIRLHAKDIKLVMRLNAQYAAMVRASLSAHGHLLREQQIRRKYEVTATNADAGEWTRHITEKAMLQAAQIEHEQTEPPIATNEFPKTVTESTFTGNETTVRPPRRPAGDIRPATSRAAYKDLETLGAPTPGALPVQISNQRPIAHATSPG